MLERLLQLKKEEVFCAQAVITSVYFIIGVLANAFGSGGWAAPSGRGAGCIDQCVVLARSWPQNARCAVGLGVVAPHILSYFDGGVDNSG
jgi:hypothetical protein